MFAKPEFSLEAKEDANIEYRNTRKKSVLFDLK
jgi:hypothetical protein